MTTQAFPVFARDVPMAEQPGMEFVRPVYYGPSHPEYYGPAHGPLGAYYGPSRPAGDASCGCFGCASRAPATAPAGDAAAGPVLTGGELAAAAVTVTVLALLFGGTLRAGR